MVEKPIRLTATDRAVLEHVALHKMTTEPVLERAGVLKNANRESVKKRLQRLRKAGYLESATLFQQRRYYHLTQQSAKLLGETVHKEMFLKDDPKVRAYGGLLFCTDPQTHCRMQSASQFRERFPKLWKPGMRLDYYLNGSDPKNVRLGYYKIDYVPKSPKWETLIDYVKEFIQSRCDQPAFRDLIYDGLFEITIITALARKAEALQAAFDELDDIPKNLNLDFYVAGDLLPLIAPEPR